MKSKLFFDHRTKKYFCSEQMHCKQCKKLIHKIGIFVGDWQKKDSMFHNDISFYCHACANKINISGIAQNKFIVLFTTQIPNNAMPVIIRPPDLIISRSCIESASDLKDGARIIDNTRVSRNPNRNIMPGALEHKEMVENHIALLDNNNSSSVDQVFKDILNSKPLIGHEDKKLLEEGDDKK